MSESTGSAAAAGKKSFDLSKTMFWRGLEKCIRFVMVLSSVSTTVVILASVFMRYVLKGNFYGAEDLMVMFAFWLYFIGGVYGSYENSHIKADIVAILVKNVKIRDSIGLLAQTICVVVNAILFKWSTDYMLWDLQTMPTSTALKIPQIIPHSAIFIGLGLMLFYHIYYLQKNIRLFAKQGYYGEPPKNKLTAEEEAMLDQPKTSPEGGEA